MKMFRLLLLLVLLLPPVQLLAASDDDLEYRYEVGGGLGVNFSLTDVNSQWYGNVNFAGGAIFRFTFNPRMALKTSLNYGQLTGKTDDLKNFYPVSPNTPGTEKMSFKADSKIIDLSALYEINFFPYGFAQSYLGHKRITPYLQLGLGMAYSTGGKAFTANIPLGFGVKYKIVPRLNLGFEWRMHLSLSDKLENLEAPLGIKSSGFKNKDHYSFTFLTLTYDLSPRCPNCNKD